MSSAVKKVAQVAVGAVIGFVQGGPWGALAGAALAFYVSSQQDQLKTDSLRAGEPSSQTLRSSKAAARYVLGRVSTGGVLSWGQEQAGGQTNGEWLHMVYVLSEGEVDGLEAIYLGEEDIRSYGDYVSYELVVNPTQVNAFLKANCPDWRDTQIGRGLSYVRMSFKYSAEKYPSGIPDVRFVMRGRRDIYDPRTGFTGYSENTALHILWFLRNRCGVPDDEIVFSSFASSANVCDESVANPDGSTSPRYRSGCVIGADESRTQVMQKLQAACGGKLIRVGGRWMLQVGAYYGPYDFEITEDMVIGTVTGSTEPSNDSVINTVRGTFMDASQAWAETDYPEVSVAEWIIADGGEAAETLAFSYVSDPYQAQRLANIELRRRRAGGTLSIPMNFVGYNCRPGRSVKVNLPSLNIVGEFIVTDWAMAVETGCNVSVAQNEPAIFDDAVGQPYNPLGFISLPTGGLGSPTNLTWSTDDAAEVVQGVLSWTPPSGAVTGYAITVRQGGLAVQAQQVPATAVQLPLAGLPSGNYAMSVAALGPLTRSGEASITVNIDGPPIPESCIVQATIDTITLIPGNALHGLNGGTYEYFFSTDPQASQGGYLGQGLSLTHTGLAFATNYAYFVRSKNAYGVSAFLKVVASTSSDMTAMLAGLKDKIDNGLLAPELRKEIELISGDGPGSVNERIGELQDEIGNIVDALAYVPTDAYVRDNTVRVGDNLWTAIADVPAAADGSNGPPNPTYWVNSGQSIRAANGLAAQVNKNTADISTVDGKTTVAASQLRALQASYRDDDGEGQLADALNAWNSTASFVQEVKTQAEENFAQTQRTTALAARVGGSESRITTVETTVATNQSATSTALQQLQASVAGNTAAVQRNDQAIVEANGRVSAISSWKTETNSNGKKVATGIIQGSDGTVGEILLSADRVAIINGLDGPEANLFVFQGGQLFLNSALINTAFIQDLILGMTLRSQALDSQGRPLIELNMVTGTFTVRGQDANGSTLLNNGGLYVYDANNVERTAVGRLSGPYVYSLNYMSSTGMRE
ncbi:phage tail tip fiber protein [Pseudomonas alkylphenolica]|uniref:phage tail tip fiber protein n=1 Tax=Pseudomonas alkylphenolica TaxID=237609 RepID=UPI00315CAAB6